MVPQALGLEGEIVGIHPDAVPPHQPGAEGEKIPFRPRRLQNLQRVDALALKNQGQFIHQGNVEVTLGVLDDLGGLRSLDVGGHVNPSRDDGAVNLRHETCSLRGISGDDLPDLFHRMFLVTRIDALGGIAGKEVRPPAKPAFLLDQGKAVLLGAARIHRRLVDHGGSRPEVASNQATGLDQCGQVRTPMPVDGGRHGDDDELRFREHLGVGGEADRMTLELLPCELLGAVMAGIQFPDAALIDVESDDLKLGGKGHRQRETDVAKADDTDRMPARSQGRKGHWGGGFQREPIKPSGPK